MATIRHRTLVYSSKNANFGQNGEQERQTDASKICDDNKLKEKQEDPYSNIQGTLEEIKDTLKSINSKINGLEELILFQKKVPMSLLDNSHVLQDERQLRTDKLPEKEFKLRRSLLTELFEIVHIKTLYNIFIATLIILLLCTAISDVLETGTTYLGIEMIKLRFEKFSTALIIWLGLKLSTLLVFYFFKFWAEQYRTNDQKSFLTTIKNVQYLISYIIYIIVVVYLPLKVILKADLAVCSTIAVLIEQTRLLMKTYAFVRSNVPKVMLGKRAPELSKFIYFMFAPTIVYKDNYPRKRTINWTIVIRHFTEVVLIIFYQSYLYERIIIPHFRNYGLEPLNIRTLILSIFGTMLPATLILLSGFYLFLHAWMNAWAEMLRFGDRMFYKDWWNVSTLDQFFRTWNIVVHDWLYTYIYKDIYEYLNRRNKAIPLLTTFMISAIVHEYILAFSFRFFYPLIFTTLGVISVLIIFICRWFNIKLGNLFMWFNICIGNGIIVSLYLTEAFARINCPPYNNGTLDLFVPRSLLTCNHNKIL